MRLLSHPVLTLLKGRSPYLSTTENFPSLPIRKSITPKTSLKPLISATPERCHLFPQGNISLPLNKGRAEPFHTGAWSACAAPQVGARHSWEPPRSSQGSEAVTGCWHALKSHPDKELRVQQESTSHAGKILLNQSLEEARSTPPTFQRSLPAQASGT